MYIELHFSDTIFARFFLFKLFFLFSLSTWKSSIYVGRSIICMYNVFQLVIDDDIITIAGAVFFRLFFVCCSDLVWGIIHLRLKTETKKGKFMKNSSLLCYCIVGAYFVNVL